MEDCQPKPPTNTNDTSSKLNWLRAAVLGANDGIVSISGLVVGVASATNSRSAVLAAGIAGILAGALSMAVGEYVSVSSQRDAEKSILDEEHRQLHESPEEELQELANIYQEKGLKSKTALQVAKELTKHDHLSAHAHAEHGIDPHSLVSPTHAAVASAISFTLGAMIPFAAIVTLSDSVKIPATFAAVLVALVLTGSLSAKIGNAPVTKATIRVVIGGFVAMAVTYGIGHLFNTGGI